MIIDPVRLEIAAAALQNIKSSGVKVHWSKLNKKSKAKWRVKASCFLKLLEDHKVIKIYKIITKR